MEINTERLVLREFEPDDWRILLAYASRPEVRRHLLRGQGTEGYIRRYVEKAILWSQQPERLFYGMAIHLKGRDELIGSCALQDAWPGGPSSIGWDLNPDFWGQGYMTEAARALVDLAFGTIEVHSVMAHCAGTNIASVRVMEKIGMRKRAGGFLFEWALALYYLQPQRVVEYSILQHEWAARRAPGGPHRSFAHGLTERCDS